MHRHGFPINILAAEADADDRMLLQEVFTDANLHNPLDFVENGEELMQYLRREGEFANLKDRPLPDLILLSLKLPKLDGPSALAEIKCDAELGRIPVIMLTISQAEQEILQSHGIGADSFLSKPVSANALIQTVCNTLNCWINVVAPVEAGCGEAA